MDSTTLKMPPMPEEYKKKFNDYMKLYRDTHKNNIEASRKKWHNAHKDDDEYKKKKNKLANNYYHTNKGTLLAPTRCACGGVVSKLTQTQHNKTQKHTKYIESLTPS
jgi:hypothetical protein